jgi:hypothetical protein
MKRHGWRLLAILLWLVLLPILGAYAQQTTAAPMQPLLGQVTGQVFCQDTGLPARFAAVRLVPEKPPQSPTIAMGNMGKNVDVAKMMAKVMAEAMKGSNLATVTGMDGGFSFDKVPPGSYYLIAQLPGYLSPLSGLSEAERMKADSNTVAAVESVAQKVVVAGGSLSSVNLSLERGATLGGKITYDDGSPAPGVIPTLLTIGKDGKWKQLSPLSIFPSITDDRGQFRFFGLPAGKYAVKATLPVSQAVAGLGAVSAHINTEDALVVYQGGALREKEIKPIELGDGDHRDGIEVIFPVNGLHSLSGSVVAKYDKHPVNSGTVELQESDTNVTMRTATIGQDGTFKLSYVPEGNYVLKATAADMEQQSSVAPANDFERSLNSKILRSYGAAEVPLLVSGDVNGIAVQVPEQQHQ